jgi:shikimate kinase
MKETATTVWLRAPIELLLARTQRRNTRPLLKEGSPRETLERLLREREPIYAEADLTVDSLDGPHQFAIERIIEALNSSGVVEQ